MDARMMQGWNKQLSAWERSILDEGGLYLVGGAVRDRLLGHGDRTADDDYVVTGIAIDRLVELLSRHGVSSLVGSSFGVIKFTPADAPTVDISLPRREVSTGAGHRDFDVVFDEKIPIEEDLARRDFTVNSMAFHLGERRIVDPLDGKADIAARRLRVNRSNSFVEDPLRILRGVQLLARFDLEATSETIERMRTDRALIESVAPERVRMEFDKMLIRSDRPSNGFLFMRDIGLLDIVLPEIAATDGVTQNEYHIDDVFMHGLKTCDGVGRDLVLRWAGLLHDIGKPAMRQERNGRVVFHRHEAESARMAGGVLERLRYSKTIITRVVHLVRHHMFDITTEWSDAAVRRFIARVGAVHLDDLFALAQADVASRGDVEAVSRLEDSRHRIERLMAADAAFSRGDLAVDGRDVMQMLDMDPGPGIGGVLDRLLDMVLEDPAMNDRNRLLSVLERMREEMGD